MFIPLVQLVPVVLLFAGVCAGLVWRTWRNQRHHSRCVSLCHRIADELSRGEDATLATEHIFQAVLEHAHAPIGVLSLRSAIGDPLTVACVQGLSPRVLSSGRMLKPEAQGWECPGIRVTGDAQLVHHGLRTALQRAVGIRLNRWQNMLCIPVMGREVNGMLQLVSPRWPVFGKRDLFELRAVGSYVAAAIYNARLIGTITRKHDAAEALYEIGLDIAASLDFEQVLMRAVEQAQRLLDADIVWFIEVPEAVGEAGSIRGLAGPLSSEFRIGMQARPGMGLGKLLRTADPSREPPYMVLQDLQQELGSGPLAQDAGTGVFCDIAVEHRLVALGVHSMLAVPVRIDNAVRGLLCSFSLRRDAYREFEIRLFLRFANQVCMALSNAELHRSRGELAVMQERERLSNELHDNMAQIINGLSLEFHSIAKLARQYGDGLLSGRVQHLESALRDAKAAIRQAVFELRLPEHQDLWATIHGFLTKFQNWHDLVVHECLPDGSQPLPLQAQREVLRIIQESLWNVRKHSGSAEAWVSASYAPGPGHLTLQVRDRGRGAAQHVLSSGQGIATMRDRATRLGGTLGVSEMDGGGLMINLVFPVNAARTERTSWN